MIEKLKFRHLLIYLLPIILVVSNLGIFSNNILRKGALYSIFAILIITYLFITNFIVTKRFFALCCTTLFILLYLIVVKGMSITNDRVIFIILDLGMIYIGKCMIENEEERIVDNVLKTFIAVCTFSCVYYLLNFDTTLIYGYQLKHCLAANILISFLLLLFSNKLSNKKIRVILIILHIYTIFALHSRSTLVGLLLACMIALFLNRGFILAKLKQKRYFIGIAILLLICLPFVPRIKQLFISGLRLNTIQSIGIERYSADRIPMIRQGLEYFTGNELLGIANKSIVQSSFYIESFPIDILIQLGIVGFLLYVVWFALITAGLKTKNASSRETIISKITFIALLSIGLFQANAPMGPGTAYAFAWVIIGMNLT